MTTLFLVIPNAVRNLVVGFFILLNKKRDCFVVTLLAMIYESACLGDTISPGKKY